MQQCGNLIVMRRIDKNRYFERQSSLKDIKTGGELAIEPVFYSCAFVKAKTNYEYKTHIHPMFEIIISEKGVYKCLLNGENIRIGPGEFLIVQTGDVHQDIFSKGIEYSALSFLLRSSKLSTGETRLFRKKNAREQKMRLPAGSRVPELFKILKKEASTQQHGTFGFYILTGLFNAIFWDMISLFPESSLAAFFIKSAKEENFRITLLNYLRDNVNRKLNVEEMARAMKMSESSFAHLSRKILGSPPAKVFLACKLERAATLIKESGMTIKEVSDHLAFEDQFHFSKAFRKHFGTPPSVFK